jgi:hypothetical protein
VVPELSDAFCGERRFDQDGNPIKRGIPHLEIEVRMAIVPPATNSAYFVRIGDKEWGPGGRGCAEAGCVKLVLTPEDFASLRERAIVSDRNGGRADPVALGRDFENGEPSIVVGAKFGRLDKSMIDRFPTIERNANDQ